MSQQHIETEEERRIRLRNEAIDRAEKHASTMWAAENAPNDPWFTTDVTNPYADDIRLKQPYYSQIAYHKNIREKHIRKFIQYFYDDMDEC